MNDEMVQAESGGSQRQLSFDLHCVLKLNLLSSLSPLHVWRLCVDLTQTFVLGAQQRAGLRGVLALQPVLIKGLQGGVDLRETDWQAAVGLLHLLYQGFIRPASRLALRLSAAAQAP